MKLPSTVDFRSHIPVRANTPKNVERRRRTPKDAVFEVIKLSTKTPPCVFVVF